MTMTPSLLGPPPAVSTEAATLEFPEYIVKHGKIPMLGDDPPPWAYRGWLLHYVQLADFAINKENSRWAYMLEMFETGQMPERPIPQIKFGEPDCQIFKKLGDWSALIGYDCGGWRDFGDLVAWFMWGLCSRVRSPHFIARTPTSTCTRVSTSH